jgi:integrase
MLTDTAIRNAKSADKDYSLADAIGLRLLVRSSGAKLWQYRFRIAGKASIFSIGAYPAVRLSDARKAAAEAREQVAQGINPAQARKTLQLTQHQELATTFQGVSEEWIKLKKLGWTPYYLRQITRFFASDVYPVIGSMPIRQVTAAHILAILKKAEARGAESVAINLRQWIGAVFRYAVSTLRADVDPAAALKGAITKPKTEHAKALSKEEIAKLSVALEKHGGYPVTRIALKLLMLTMVRTGELRQAEWLEFDLDHAEWRVPAERMKMREIHIVPLSRQSVALLTELKMLTGGNKYLFPNIRQPKTCMTGTTINRALERMGFTAIGFSGHGFRATASTMLNEMGYRSDLIERQLAHADRNKVRASYNQAEYLPERQAMLQRWADVCDSLMAGNRNIIPFESVA